MKKALTISGSAIALGLYIPLVIGILQGKIEQSFATWILWVALDAIVLGSTIKAGGKNYPILICYCIGGTVITLSLVYMGIFTWTWFETSVTVLVVICLFVWYIIGAKATVITTTIAVVLSGIPQFKDSWQSPDTYTGWIYLGYVFANGFSFFGAKSWTIEDRFYTGMCTLLTFALTFAAWKPF